MIDSSEAQLELQSLASAGRSTVRWFHEGIEYSLSAQISSVTVLSSDTEPLQFTLSVQLLGESRPKGAPYSVLVSTTWGNGEFQGLAAVVDCNYYPAVSKESSGQPIQDGR